MTAIAQDDDDQIVKTAVRLPKSAHRQLKQYCLDSDKSIAEAITEAVLEYLKNHNANRKIK